MSRKLEVLRRHGAVVRLVYGVARLPERGVRENGRVGKSRSVVVVRMEPTVAGGRRYSRA